MGGGQFANITFMEIIKRKIISSLELFPSKGFFDLGKQGNRLKMFLNRYEHSFVSKRRCKGDTVKHKVVANLPWTDSYERITQKLFAA